MKEKPTFLIINLYADKMEIFDFLRGHRKTRKFATATEELVAYIANDTQPDESHIRIRSCTAKNPDTGELLPRTLTLMSDLPGGWKAVLIRPDRIDLSIQTGERVQFSIQFFSN
jgi:hypothetical protein